MSARDLNEAQQDAVKTTDNILCCACPGSGKTRVLVEKTTHILNVHPNPHIILTTFSRDAANEIKERVYLAIPAEKQKRLTIGTFHALALKQLKESGFSSKILSEIEVETLMLRSIRESGSKLDLESCESVIARCKEDKQYRQDNPKHAKLTKKYCELQREANACDFIDILLLAITGMKVGKISPLRVTHFFADEMQDIDAIQLRWMLLHLNERVKSCAVGDDDQSIFGFRKSMGYLGMMNYVEATGSRIIKLDTNYRSTPNIVESANRLIKHNLDRIPKQIKTIRRTGKDPILFVAEDAKDEEQFLISHLDRICGKNPRPFVADGAFEYRFAVQKKQVAILTRTNIQHWRIGKILQQKKIPYMRTGYSFLDSEVVQVYLTILQMVIRQDAIGVEVALKWAGIKPTELSSLEKHLGRDLFFLSDPEHADPVFIKETKREIQSFTKYSKVWIRSARAKAHNWEEGVILGVYSWMSDIMLEKIQDHTSGSIIKDKAGKRNIDVEKLKTVKDSLLQFFGPLPQRILALQKGDESDVPRVILSTFHASKGLEWDHVFLLDVHTGLVPKITQDSSDAEVEEERRVFYVAMTRARDELFVVLTNPKKPSEFIDEARLFELGH